MDVERAIEYAVRMIRERYSEPISLDQLADAAMVSKFHFLRTFRRITGVTPGRFLSAVRLEEAKRLLLTTSLNVSDISAQVGYSSTGSFTRRFTESVGCPPTQYRYTARLSAGTESAPVAVAVGAGGRQAVCGAVSGVVRVPDAPVSGIYLGAFDNPIIERCPATRAVITEPGPFRMDGIPQGLWYIHAVAYAEGGQDASGRPPLLVDTFGPLAVGPGTQAQLSLTLRPLGWSNPPVLLALPNLSRPVVAA